MVGAMIANTVSVPINITFYAEGEPIMVLGEALDSIMPKLLPLGLSLGIVGLYKKKVNPMLLIVVLMGIGMLGGYFGFF